MLDALAAKYGTDKRAGIHNYTAVYERHFAPIRERAAKVVEIGVLGGASVRMWEEYFPAAQIIGLDIKVVTKRWATSRISIHIADQGKPEDLRRVIAETGGDFDIVIDDGSHLHEHQRISFETLFPAVRSGGLYAIEDLHASPGAVEFLKGLVDDVNKHGAGYGDHERAVAHMREQGREPTELEMSVAAVHFYPNLAIIEKR